MRNAWFSKFINCSFWLDERYTGKNDAGEYIFQGTFTNTDNKSGLPLQYIYEAEGKPQIMLTYKEARIVMGCMIEKYKGRK